MMPLWTTETLAVMCGCALRSVGRPCVAQRVWPMPVRPASGSVIRRLSRLRELALGAAALEVAVLDGGDAGRIIAAILEPAQRIDEVGCDRRFPRIPTMPHMANYPLMLARPVDRDVTRLTPFSSHRMFQARACPALSLFLRKSASCTSVNAANCVRACGCLPCAAPSWSGTSPPSRGAPPGPSVRARGRRRDVLGDDAARADIGAVADFDRGHERRVRADEGPLADLGPVLVEAVVVAEDGAGADVGPGADACRRRGRRGGWPWRPAPMRRLLDLDEIADVHVGAELGAGPQPRERPDARVRRRSRRLRYGSWP